MKTTFLFKMNGAWSPLWNLSDKSCFEIKSKEPIMFLGIDLANPAPDFMCMMEQVVGSVEKACSIPDSFIEYQNFTDLACSALARSFDIFGCSEQFSDDRKRFVELSVSGIPFVVLNKGDGNFEFRS